MNTRTARKAPLQDQETMVGWAPRGHGSTVTGAVACGAEWEWPCVFAIPAARTTHHTVIVAQAPGITPPSSGGCRPRSGCCGAGSRRRGSLPCLQAAACALCPHVAEKHSSSSSSSHRALCRQAQPLQKTPNATPGGAGLQHMNGGQGLHKRTLHNKE